MNKDELYKLIKSTTEDTKGFIKHNGIKVEEVNDNNIEVYVDIKEESMNPYGAVHGGLIFGLADTVMGMGVATNGRKGVTINSQIDYLRPGIGSKLKAVAEKIKIGKTTAVYRCNIYNDKDELIAIATGTYMFID